jgi:phytoene dehydrogenase-like protein
MLWAIQDLRDEEAKILTLWFNSTINISQILSKRAETEGAFMGIDQYTLQEFLTLDPAKLSQERKDQLVKIFDEQARTKLPSILEQLRTKNTGRKKIDLALLQALGIKGDHEELLNAAYLSVQRTIETLATLMKEDQAEG